MVGLMILIELNLAETLTHNRLKPASLSITDTNSDAKSEDLLKNFLVQKN